MADRERARLGRILTIILTAVAISFAATGCTAALPRAAQTPAPSATSSALSPTPSAATAPVLQPDGSAQDNLAYFDFVNRRLLAAKPKAKGRDFIDALVAAGFAKKNMQVTPDTTTIGLVAQSIQFSVKLNGGCLIGQNGADTGYQSVVAPVLTTGTCLVGETRTIHW